MNNDTDTARLRKLDQDQDHHLHPFTNLSKHSQQGGRTISPAEHIYIYDSDGNKMLDGMSALQVLQRYPCCASANIIKSAADDIAPYFQQHLQTLKNHPIVGEVHGIGMLGAVELVRDKHSRERLAPDAAGAVYCRDRANATGLMVRQSGDTMITAPPLICNHSEIDSLVNMLKKTLDQTAEHFNIR